MFKEIHRVLKPKGILFVSSLSASETHSNFPDNFDAQARVLFENEIPYQFIPTPEFLEREVCINAVVERLQMNLA